MRPTLIFGRQSWGVLMKLGKNGKNRVKTTLKTQYQAHPIGGSNSFAKLILMLPQSLAIEKQQ